MSIEYSAFESGLDWFIRRDNEADSIGMQGLIDWSKRVCMKGRRVAVRYPATFKATVIGEFSIDPQNEKLRA